MLGAAERLQETWQYPRFSKMFNAEEWFGPTYHKLLPHMGLENDLWRSNYWQLQEKLIYIATLCRHLLGICDYTICISYFTSLLDRDGDIAMGIWWKTTFRHFHIFDNLYNLNLHSILFLWFLKKLKLLFISFISRLVIQIRFEPHLLH